MMVVVVVLGEWPVPSAGARDQLSLLPPLRWLPRGRKGAVFEWRVASLHILPKRVVLGNSYFRCPSLKGQGGWGTKNLLRTGSRGVLRR